MFSESWLYVQELSDNARCTIIEKYDFRTVCLPQQCQLIENTKVTQLEAKKVSARAPAALTAPAEMPQAAPHDRDAAQLRAPEAKAAAAVKQAAAGALAKPVKAKGKKKR